MTDKEKFLILYNGIDSIMSTTGFHPAAIIKDNITIPRDEYGNGWNDASSKILEKLGDLLDKIECNKEFNSKLEVLLLSGSGWLKDNKLFLNMNDIFFYACADSEEVPEDKINEVANLFTRFGLAGLIYWVSEQRKELPQIKKYITDINYVKSQIISQ